MRILLWHERGRMSSPCGLGELEQVVGGADERPFGSDLFEATQKELSEAPGILICPKTGSTICFLNR